VRRFRNVIALALAVVALALALVACGGEDEETSTGASPAEAPSGAPGAPSAGALPPALVDCFADRGFELQSPTEIHSAPPQVVQECFGILHQGGGAP
jgi:hypothetical protein